MNGEIAVVSEGYCRSLCEGVRALRASLENSILEYESTSSSVLKQMLELVSQVDSSMNMDDSFQLEYSVEATWW